MTVEINENVATKLYIAWFAGEIQTAYNLFECKIIVEKLNQLVVLFLLFSSFEWFTTISCHKRI